MQHEFLFSGFGGQGVMFVGQLLAYAAMDSGLNATWIPSYGPEMRGGTAHCYVILSANAIGSPIVQHPKVALVFNNPSYQKYEPEVMSGGVLVSNTSLIHYPQARTDIAYVSLPASDLAQESGDLKLTNMVMLAAALSNYEVLPIEAIQHALEHHIPAHRRNMLEMNHKALRAGWMFGKEPVLS